MAKQTFIIGTSTIPGGVIIPQIMPELLRRRPDLQLKLEITDSRETFNLVRSGRLELGIIGTQYEADDITYETIKTGDQLVLIVPKGHAFTDQGFDSLEKLKGEPFVSREPGSGTRATYEQALSKAGFSPQDLNIVAEISNNEGVIQAVESGLGISILSRSIVQESNRCGNIEIIDPPIPLTRDFYVITLKQGKLSPTAQDILSLIEDLMK